MSTIHIPHSCSTCLGLGLGMLLHRRQVDSIMDFGSGSYKPQANGIHTWCLYGDSATEQCDASDFSVPLTTSNISTRDPSDYVLALDLVLQTRRRVQDFVSSVVALGRRGAVISFSTSNRMMGFLETVIAKLVHFGFRPDDAGTHFLRSGFAKPTCDCPRSMSKPIVLQRVGVRNHTFNGQYHGSWTADARRMRAYFINADIDVNRRLETLKLCAKLQLDCHRIAPPALDSLEVRNCVHASSLQAWECSLVYAHRSILSFVSALPQRAIVLEDDARMNANLKTEEARQLLHSAVGDFIMGGWCHPSCSHAYVVSSSGARRLLERGFHDPKKASDQMFPDFIPKQPWPSIREGGGKLLYPSHCPQGFEHDIGLFCQDRSTAHSKIYYLEQCQYIMRNSARTKRSPRRNINASQEVGYSAAESKLDYLMNGCRQLFDSSILA